MRHFSGSGTVGDNKKQDVQVVAISFFNIGQPQNWWDWNSLRTQWLSAGRRLVTGFSENMGVEMNPGHGSISKGDFILDKGTKKNSKLCYV